MIEGILGFIKSIYYAVASVGSFFDMLFRYIGQFFNFIGYVLGFTTKFTTFLPAPVAAVLISLLILLLILKVVGRE